MAEIVNDIGFSRRAYRDALSLVVEARNYLAFQLAADTADFDDESRLLVSLETMRLSCRLTQVMAWLLAQRATEEGEISMARALSDEFGLDSEDICLDDTWTFDPRLPPAVRSLLDRSLKLYVRTQRLDGMMRQKVA